MAIELGDVFIGNYKLTQGFGANPDYYKNFGLQGHEGLDWGTPVGTPVIAAHDGVIIRDTDSPIQGKNYGINCVNWNKDGKFATYYCHLSSNVVSVGQSVIKGQLLGYTGDTGNTTGPHLHFNLCRTNEDGVRTNTDNGYLGFVNPNDKRIAVWVITNPSEPIKPPSVTIPVEENLKPMLTLVEDAFKALPETDPNSMARGGNLEGYIRAIVKEHLNYSTHESNSKQFEGFVAKWLQEWQLTPDGTIIDIEKEMDRMLDIEDTARRYRDALEEVAGYFEDDDALLKAVEAVNDNKQKLIQELNRCKLELAVDKPIKTVKLGKYLVKLYAQNKNKQKNTPVSLQTK